MKVIIYGTSEIASLIAKELYSVHDVTVIGGEEEMPEEFNKLDISYISGSGTSIGTLETAGIKKADVFIACSKIEETNIVASWTAKKVSEVETVCFVTKQEYLETLGKSSPNGQKIESGIDHMIWPEQLLMQEIFRIILVPEAIDVEIFAGGKARLLEYRIKEESSMLNKKIKDCYFPEDSLIVGITREEELFIPDGNTELTMNDKVIFMGSEDGLNNLAAQFFEKRKRSTTSTTIIGGGNVGFMLAQNLENIGIRTKIIEVDADRCDFLSDNLKKTLVIKGDGTDLELLESEDIGNSEVIVSVTNNDEKNLLCSLLAKQLGVKRVITRVSKARNINLFEKVGIDVAVSPIEAALKEIRNKLLEKGVNILALVEKGQGEVIEITIPQGFQDTKIMDLHIPCKTIIGAIKRGNKILIPKGNTYIRANDDLMIFTTMQCATKAKEFFK
ncbi:MAG: potassium transporter TrkA [Candidatus Melainabacteria bacterium GWF2_37_15]|nr:MAG: potassium transporter TrkA [Candidatus Melainabacteria bacterium GWF2_37_15]